jgi:hypothetical protein
MVDYPKHLYMIVFPINALVASQLEPEDFGMHYAVGSTKHYSGKVIFVELDVNFREPYFEIDKYLEETKAHPVTGRPKRTKFISSYAVLEHVPLNVLQNLYLVHPNGKVLPLEKGEYTAINQPGLIRIYQEICPLETLVASTLDQREFGQWITRGTKSKGAPKILFTQIDFNIDKFFEENQGKAIITCAIPNVNPYRVKECIEELRANPEKLTKTISLGSVLKDISFSLIRHGFWFVDGDEMVFYPMPTIEELETKFFYWWKYAAK